MTHASAATGGFLSYYLVLPATDPSINKAGTTRIWGNTVEIMLSDLLHDETVG